MSILLLTEWFSLWASQVYKIIETSVCYFKTRRAHSSWFSRYMLLVADSEAELKASIERALHLLQDLGSVLNWGKSVLSPCKKLTHLGFEIDSELMAVTIPTEKMDKIIQMCHDMLAKSQDSIREVERVIGCIVACFPAVLVAPLHYRSLEHAKDEALKVSRGNFNVLMRISADMKVKLAWWAANIRSQSKPILETTPEVTITSDASMDGWGGAYMDRKVGGRWDERERANKSHQLSRSNWGICCLEIFQKVH